MMVGKQDAFDGRELTGRHVEQRSDRWQDGLTKGGMASRRIDGCVEATEDSQQGGPCLFPQPVELLAVSFWSFGLQELSCSSDVALLPWAYLTGSLVVQPMSAQALGKARRRGHS